MRKIARLTLGFGIVGLSWNVMANESSIPLSAFRKYFWGARQAYQDRDFAKAEKLMHTYRKLGLPSDPLLKAAGCDPNGDVDLFTTALKETRACLERRANSPHWTDAEHAKFAVTMALRSRDAAALEPYVDCAPTDLTAQVTTCGAYLYRQPADLERLAAHLKKSSDILQWPNWRETSAQDPNRRYIRWVLYTASDHWKPCGMQGASLISLSEDPPGEFRIAGFAADCF